jgi:hypothetical protein
MQNVFSKSVSTLAAIVLFGALLGPRPASSQAAPIENGGAVKQRKSTKSEVELQHARARALAILRGDNGCSVWFRETDPDAAAVFESLRIDIAGKSREFVLRTTDARGVHSYKHPWGARSNQLAGPGSLVEVNPEGPFFMLSLPVADGGRGGAQFHYYGGFRTLTVGGFPGDSLEAQITILLHELAHVIGRIPEDDDSWDGRSSRNTQVVLRNCRGEILDHAQRSVRAAN